MIVILMSIMIILGMSGCKGIDTTDDIKVNETNGTQVIEPETNCYQMVNGTKVADNKCELTIRIGE